MKKIPLFFVFTIVFFNSKLFSQTIPEIYCPDNIVVSNDTGNCSALVTFEDATASDAEDGALTTTQTLGLVSGSAFPVGETLIEFSATDNDANTVSCQFTVTVQDTQVPVVVCKQDYEIDLDATGNATINTIDLIESVEENCSYTIQPQTLSFTCEHLGASNVNFILTDLGNNIINCNVSVLINDITPPLLIPKQDIIISLDVVGEYVVTPDDILKFPESDDACGFDELYTDVTNVNCADIDVPIMVTVFATDQSGNTASCQQVITVVDDMAPILECPSNHIEKADWSYEYYLPDYFALATASATDNCTNVSEIIYTQTPVPGTYLEINYDTDIPPYIISFTSEDSIGNISNCSFELIVHTPCGVEEESMLQKLIDIFPNPVIEEIRLSNNQGIHLEKALIYNINGTLLKQVTLNSIASEIKISSIEYPSGIYLIRIISGKESIVKKFIIE